MEVLKSGNTRSPWKRRTTCRCKAELIVSKTDCELVLDSRDGNFYKVHCPECNHMITIQATLVDK